jgi:hypothetical protein
MQIAKHLILTHRAKPYINADLFENDVQTLVPPLLAIFWLMHSIPEEDAVRLMNYCSPHLTSVVIDFLSNSRLGITTFALHATDILQLRDLALFGLLKARRQYQLPFRDGNGSARLPKKGRHDFQSTMTETNIGRA